MEAFFFSTSFMRSQGFKYRCCDFEHYVTVVDRDVLLADVLSPSEAKNKKFLFIKFVLDSFIR